LSIKGVDLIVLRVVEAFRREVLRRTQTLHTELGVANDPLLFPVVEEVVMLDQFVMEQIDEKQVVVDEAAVDEWVWEVVDRHRVVVKP
tara:strand:+ start:904 stop:1167 length:264 start_codon:yes stop_codon:yes gene_type:complete